MAFIKNWFSNMLLLDAPFEEDGNKYYTVENYYQAHKFIGFKRSFVSKLDPYKAKRFARDNKWDVFPFDKLGVMEKALKIKFAKETYWWTQLMATGSDEIVEWNNWNDKYWGKDVNSKEGENHLGKLLMKIRDEYKENVS